MKSLIPKDKTGYAMNRIGDWEVWDCGRFCGVFTTYEEARKHHREVKLETRRKLKSSKES